MHDIAILEDHPLVSRITREVVEACAPGIDILCFEDMKSFLEANIEPKTILSDLALSDSESFNTIKSLTERYPNTPLLICSGIESGKPLEELKKLGIRYINKRAKTSEMVNSIRDLLKQGNVINETEDIVGLVDGRNTYQSQIIAPGSTKPLTLKQVEIMEHCAKGLSSKETARALGMSMDTVRSHMTEIFARLSAKNVAQAVDIFNHAKRAAELRGQNQDDTQAS